MIHSKARNKVNIENSIKHEIVMKIDDWESKHFGDYDCDCVPASDKQKMELAGSIVKKLKELQLLKF